MAPASSLPLEPGLLHELAPGLAGRPGVVSVFLPRAAARASRARGIVEASLDQERLPAPTWRTVPADTAALGREARATCPGFEQAFVERPAGLSDARFELRLVLARRRMEAAARAAGSDLAEFAVPSASCRTIVYKGLVAGERLAELYPDLAAGPLVSHAIFHQRYATNTRPDWRLAQPFRAIAHNGEINTVRTNRQEVHGRTADPGGRPVPRRGDWSRRARCSRPTARIPCPSTRRSSSPYRPAGACPRRSWR